MRRLAVLLALAGCGGGEDGEATVVDAAAPAVDAGAPPRDAADTGEAPSVDAGAAPADVGAPWVEIGTGTRTFQPLTPGQQVPIIEGIQGGYHVWGGFQGAGFDDTDIAIGFSLTLDGAELAAAAYTEPDLPVLPGGLYSYAAVAVIFHENDQVQPSSGQTMTLTTTLTTRDGLVLEDAIEVVPVCCE